MNRFAKYAWGVLAYNIAVVVWGAYVRASKAGAGCGEHWPDCNGQVIPLAGSAKTLIEFTHRATSGLAGVAVLVLLVWAFRAFPKKHSVRTASVISFVFIIVEGLIGAVLVKKGLVADNDSIARAVVISIHLVNTLLLLAVLAITAWWATNQNTIGVPLFWRQNFKTAVILSLCIFAVLALSATGAVTALGATLFPVNSIAEGIARDLSPTHVLQSLIWIHPVAAVVIGLLLTFIVVLLGYGQKSPIGLKLANLQIGFVVVQIILGGLNLLLHAPVWMQLVHLFMADLVWVNLILFAVTLLAEDRVEELASDKESILVTI
jgi:heme A synthase